MSYNFNFLKYDIDGNELRFHFAYTEGTTTIGEFTERYKFPMGIDATNETQSYVIQILHLIVGISYYKSLRGEISLPYDLNEAEADYLNTVYEFGLGEYSYTNKLTDMIRPFSATSGSRRAVARLDNSGAILGVGGGKDSIVAGEILKAIGLDLTTMDMATRDHHGQAGVVMDIMGQPQLRVERYVDTTIVDFTSTHNGLNGHIPLSVILAWVGALSAVVSEKKYVAMANEAGTSAGNTIWNGRDVNHQWAKSFHQEQMTQRFIHENVSPDVHYFSPIRPYSSLAIMELLSTLGRAYLTDFTSCNLVLRIDPAARPNGRWCTHCAKCVSSWLLLSSWLSTDELVEIFGRNVWEDTSLRPTLDSLLGLSGHKPLDCVGTIEELRAVTRKILLQTTEFPLLRELTPEDIPGPDIDELIKSRSPSSIPEELGDQIEQFVTTRLG